MEQELDDINSLKEFEEAPASLIETEFITGAAGTGKSYLCRERVANAPEGSIILSASTGVAAVNMGDGVTTIHSLLKFFDHNSLQDAFVNGRIQRQIRSLADDGVKEIILDEISMVSGPTLDLLYASFNEVANEKKERAIKLTCTGDFCQLPPVPEKHPDTGKSLPLKWAFDAGIWPHYAYHTTRLIKIWRQSDPTFLESLQALRRGDGSSGLAGLQSLGVRFIREAEENFDGTTLRAKNEDVDRYNQARLVALEGKAWAAKSSRWGIPQIYEPGVNGKQPGDWKQIPEAFQFKVGALVMILTNDRPDFTFANGDLGIIEGMDSNIFQIKLKRNGRMVEVGKLTRRITSKSLPEQFEGRGIPSEADRHKAILNRTPYFKILANGKKQYVLGEVEYFPLRLGWATTCHKSQGLSLDRVQIDLRSHFISSPAMIYVGTSRCRTSEGLLFIGEPKMLVEKCRVHERVKEWL
jgi:PIF1-like helicase